MERLLCPPVWAVGGSCNGDGGKAGDSSLTWGGRAVAGDRREAGRGKMTSRGQHAGDHEAGELWQGEGAAAESRHEAVHGHKDVCPWRLGRDGQRYT